MNPKGRPEGEHRSGQREGGPTAARAAASAAVRSAPAIDIVIPVYDAAADLARCVESVLRHTQGDYRLVLIDDASPDPAIGAYFAALAARPLPQLVLLRNETNLGFTGTANRGMRLSRADVILLNSDTEVTAGWLEAILRCAASNPSFGTITPFSNNAEICSFPAFCRDNPWHPGDDPEPVRRALVRAAVPTYPDLPTGVGFCMFVRRTLLDAVGVFDDAFGRGYGEENDLCLRGFAVGYRNVLCDDAFVLHLGARSFQDEKSALGARNLGILLARHPHYDAMVRDYIATDPLRPIREAALSQQRAHEPGPPGILHVIHGHGGGTEHHVRALIDASRREYRHYLAIVVQDAWQLEEHQDDRTVRTYELAHDPDEPWATLLEGVVASFNIGFVHLHNIFGAREGLLDALAATRVPYGYTVHDVHFACPTITFLGPDGMYCGGETDPERCAACLARQPAFAGIDIVAWRSRHAALVRGARFAIAPSRWAADEMQRYFGVDGLAVIPHGAPGVWALHEDEPPAPRAPPRRAPLAVLLPRDDVPTVAVLGAIGPDKGARRLERLVELARAAKARVRFVLIGYMDREHGPWQSDDALFTVHGHYRARELPRLLEHYRVRLVVFPSAGPESFSFTLSEAWASGRPVIVPPIGALAERVRASHGAGWVWSEADWRSEERMLATILARVASAAEQELAFAAAQARQVPQPSLDDMARATIAVYRRATEAASTAQQPQGLRPLAPARLRDALGYRLWYPPIPVRTAEAAELAARAARPRILVRIARRVWATRVGRVLRAVTPSPLRSAVRARLKA